MGSSLTAREPVDHGRELPLALREPPAPCGEGMRGADAGRPRRSEGGRQLELHMDGPLGGSSRTGPGNQQTDGLGA